MAILTSRYVSESLLVDGGTAELVDTLTSIIDDLAARYDLLIPCDEPLLEALSEHPAVGRVAAAMPFLPTPETLRLVLSKVAFLQVARSAGLRVPEFAMCRSAEEACAVADELGYPVVLKRARSLAASGVRLVDDEAALIEEIRAMDGEEFLVQRYVRGRVGGTTILMDHGVPVWYFSFYKLFNWPHAFGPSGGGELTDHPDIGDMIRRIGAMLNFRGLCSIDWLEEAETGLIYLVEFNPRSTPTTYYSSQAGSDFVTALLGIHLRDTAAEPLPPQTSGAGVLYVS